LQLKKIDLESPIPSSAAKTTNESTLQKEKEGP
jgi:hypothetical protein